MAAPGGAWRSKAAQARAAAAPPPAAPSPAPSKPAAKPAAKPAIEAGPSGQAVDERVLFVASVLIGYTVRVEVRARHPGNPQAAGGRRIVLPPPAAAGGGAAPRPQRCAASSPTSPAARTPAPPQVKSGEVWEGIFHALRPAGADFDVLLRWAKPVPAAGGRTPDSWDDAPAHGQAAADWQPVRPQPLFTIAAGELVQISASDVRMGAADVGAAGGWDDAGGFGTDAAISRARGAWGRERELQRWAPDEGDVAHMLHLEESVGHVERGWDQFAVRQQPSGQPLAGRRVPLGAAAARRCRWALRRQQGPLRALLAAFPASCGRLPCQLWQAARGVFSRHSPTRAPSRPLLCR